MSIKHATPVDGIDLGWRPTTYFHAWGPPLLSTINGSERRAAAAGFILSAVPGPIPEFLTQPALQDADRRAFARLHPACMGGEYLPERRPGEVEIARIQIASSTHDVTCVYARASGRRIRYRVVDEYDGDTLTGANTRTSVRPLSLGELETFFTGAWPLVDVLEMNFEGRCDVDEALGFVRRIESAFYPELDDLCRARIAAWAEERQAAEQ